MALTAPLFAGTSGKEVVAEPQPTLIEWFAGGSLGYLTELEEPMYHLHLGQDTSMQFSGWDFAWFAEIGYAEKEDTGTGSLSDNPLTGEMTYMPITINGKLEREIGENWNLYAGAGVGYAQVDVDIPFLGSDDDWVLTFQAFTGVQYDINESWEAYGGARWIYYDDADLGGLTLDLDDDLLFELGARYNF